MADDIAVIANITEQQWLVHRTYGNFVVNGCAAALSGGLCSAAIPGGSRPPAGKVQQASKDAGGTEASKDAGGAGGTECDYALTAVTARHGKMDLGDNRSLEVPIPAREVAADLCREINSDGGEASYFGVFVCAGERPTADELAQARAKLRAFYERLVFAADREWERSHSHVLINDVQRRAARALGLDKEWTYDPGAQRECPACGSKGKAGLAVCRVCGAVLDREKAVRFGILRERRADRGEEPPPPIESGPATRVPLLSETGADSTRSDSVGVGASTPTGKGKRA